MLVFAFRGLRLHRNRKKCEVLIRYDNGLSVRVARGVSVLDASRSIGLPHESDCEGRGRCSTCRVRVVSGIESLPPLDKYERQVLTRVGAPSNVRLACQLCPLEPVEATRLLPPQKVGPESAAARPGYTYGAEKEIAVLFADTLVLFSQPTPRILS